jgi:hypothetical protein
MHAIRPARNGDLAAIHMAKAQLQLSDDEYRDLMATVCNGIRSAAELDWTGRRRFLAHLQACVKQLAPQGPARHIRAPLTPAQRLMWSLWMRLADAKLVGDRTMKALEAFAQRQTGVERLQWLNKQQEDLVIISLKSWVKRGDAE